MEVYEAVRTVLAVRAYQDKPLPPEAVRRIIDAGWLTGSSMNGQPWYFILVKERAVLRQLGAMIRTGTYTGQAALAVVVVIDKTVYAESDASRAIQSMILAAWGEGIGSNWVGFYGLEAVKPLLGIPDEKEVLAIVPFGYPVKTLGKGKKKRKPLEVVAFQERFGNPLAASQAGEGPVQP
jgi:nitroreductase